MPLSAPLCPPQNESRPLPPRRRQRGAAQDSALSYLFEAHPLVVQHLVPALLQLYSDIEYTERCAADPAAAAPPARGGCVCLGGTGWRHGCPSRRKMPCSGDTHAHTHTYIHIYVVCNHATNQPNSNVLRAGQFYIKFNMRQYLGDILAHAWQLPQHREAWKVR